MSNNHKSSNGLKKYIIYHKTIISPLALILFTFSYLITPLYVLYGYIFCLWQELDHEI